MVIKEKLIALRDSWEDRLEAIGQWPKIAGQFFKTKKGIICLVAVAVVFLALIGLGCYGVWWYQQPKFHDVTMELGDELPSVEAFLTEYAIAEKAVLETPASELELNKTGEFTLQFSHGQKVEEVKLTVVDTTAPEVRFQDVTINIDELLTAEDFVVEVKDYSKYSVDFEYLEEGLGRYESERVQVIVTDKHGNETTAECMVHYRWMVDVFEAEFGQQILAEDLLFDPESDADLFDPAWLEQINNGGIGTYDFVSVLGDMENHCTVTVRDTTGPVLELQEVAIYLGETATVDDFVVSATDISGDVTVRLAEELPLEERGVYTVIVEAEDIYGNITSQEVEFRVVGDEDPPEFIGMYTLTVEKHGTPAYYYGITAMDARDGQVDFSVDTSRVDTSRAGTYYAVYTASDKEGNVATYRREVVVLHDAADTAALAASIAAELSSDPELIRNYVRDSIWYSYEWGGNDPVWYGFNQGNGNCYVHALCFQALLQEKGYETQLIWVTDKTHYWNLVKINGEWKHMDSTPGRYHERYSIMNDATRYETLSGRDWDRTAWPAVD